MTTREPTSTQSRELVATSVPGVFRRGGRYVVRYRDPQGRQRQRAAKTLTEARALKAQLASDIVRGEYRPASTITFGAYAVSWIATYQGRTSRGIRVETVEDYAAELHRRAVPHFGRRRLADITPRDIRDYAAALSATGLRPASVRQAIAPVRALLATAFEDGEIRTNPAAGVRIAGVLRDDDEHLPPKALTEGELQALLEAVAPQWRPFVEFVAHTGMRIGEAIAVRWSDVNLDTRRVHVRRRWFRGRFGPPKSAYGVRSIPLSAGMVESLEARRNEAGAVTEGALVWTNRDGRILDPSNLLERVLKPAARAAGVPWASWHTLRHTCGSLLFRHGANAKQVQHWLGHHSPAFTLAVYVHLLSEDAPAADFLDGITQRT